MYNSNDCFRHLFWIKILSVRISLSLNFENINTKTIFECHGNGLGLGSESDDNGWEWKSYFRQFSSLLQNLKLSIPVLPINYRFFYDNLEPLINDNLNEWQFDNMKKAKM